MKKIPAAFLCFFVFTLTALSQEKNSKIEIIKVSGTCEQCKIRIEKKMAALHVYDANWEIETNLLTVRYDSVKILRAEIQKQLALIGHDNEPYFSDESTYNNLPACCHYKRNLNAANPPINNVFIPEKNEGYKYYLIKGVVLEEDRRGKILPLTGATIQSMSSGNTTLADSSGVFEIKSKLPGYIIISYVGFIPDTISITSINDITVILKNASSNLGIVVIHSRTNITQVSSLSTLNTLQLGSKELSKAACCNLSESFETSPSIDVSYADAVTGIKQIQLLGLSGSYTQLLTENTAEIRGLAGSYGLTFIPGPWIESIQVTKGSGSVVNGYESIAGQINIEEKKPDKMDKLFINAYMNMNGRLESSINLSKRINTKWSTALLMHSNGLFAKNDDNNDGYLDVPTGRQYNMINRWKYTDSKGVIFQLAIKALNDKRQAGETDYNKTRDKFSTHHYGAGIEVNQYSVTGKLGYVFPQHKYKSIGLLFSAIEYTNDSYFGIIKYDGKQQSLTTNLIYQSIIGSSNHKFRTGLSFTHDNFDESYKTDTYNRTEIVPGAFFEYTYSLEKITAIAGIRIDNHNQFGLITTPRLHFKYDLAPKTNLRFSIGSGFRMANIFAENPALFVSARQYSISSASTFGYGLSPEKAWNMGFNFIHNFKLNELPASVSIDLYRTKFSNQTIVNLDTNPQKILFYNLWGKSFSNSLQAELNFELIKKLEIRLAYRWLNVKTNYHGLVLEKPLTAKHRAFINLAYETKNNWKFDYTIQWISKKRLPNTTSNPLDKQFGEYSPSFFQMAGQISKSMQKNWELYMGVENATGFMQEDLMIDANQPFSRFFDASMVWGPADGRVIYCGMRLRIK